MANKNEDALERILNKYGDVFVLLLIVVVFVLPLNTVFIICASSLIALVIIWRGIKYYLDQKHEERMMTLQVEEIMKEGPSE
jgi:hypothetical protein